MRIVKLLFLIALALSFSPAALAAGPAVSLAPAPLQVPAGQVVPLAVRVANVEGLYGFDVQLKFDPQIVQIEDADPNTPGVQWLPGSFLSYDMVAVNVADNTAGTARFAMTQLNPSEAKSGSGTLASVYVRGKAPGKSTVEISDVTLANRNGEPIAAPAANAEVQVTAAAGTPPANPTALPTASEPKLQVDAPGQQGPEATATPKVPLAAAATATQPPATAVSPAATAAGPASSTTLVAATVGAPQNTPPATPAPGPANEVAAAPTPVGAAGEPPATQAVAAESAAAAPANTPAASAPAPAAAPVIESQPSAPTHVAAVTQAPRDNTLLFAGGGLLLAAVAGAVVILLRRGR